MPPIAGQDRRFGLAARGGFTLVELLVVIMILGLLAAMTTFALWDSMTEARAARTRAQIRKIDELLMSRWESYRTRPVPVKTSRLHPEIAARQRLLGLRELMRMEMPDRISDVADGPALLTGRPALNEAYRRRVLRLPNGFNSWSAANQQAECLYMILASIQDGTRNGLDFFRQNEIGDTDGDGMPEVLDGWGNPIRFLRWAPGYHSPLQPFPPSATNVPQSYYPPGQNQRSPELRPDPFDLLRVDPRWKNNSPDDHHYPYGSPPAGEDAALDDPYQLFPLVFSAGADGLYHVVIDAYATLRDDDYDDTNGQFNGGTPLRYRNTNASAYANYSWASPYPTKSWPTKQQPPNNWVLWNEPPRNDPYVILPGCALRIGGKYPAPFTGAEDNIDNHSLVVR